MALGDIKSEEAWLNQTLASLRRVRSAKPLAPQRRGVSALKIRTDERADSRGDVLTPEVSAWQANTLRSLANKDIGRSPRLPSPRMPDLNYKALTEITEEPARRTRSSSPQSAGSSPQDRRRLKTMDVSELLSPKGRTPKANTLDFSEHIASQEGAGANMASLQAILPDPKGVLERLRTGQDGLSESELNTMRTGFNRYTNADSPEVHKDDLCRILSHMGYVHTESSLVAAIADDVTKYTTLDMDEFIKFVELFAKTEREYFRGVFDKFDEDGSGTLDADEVSKYISECGFVPLRKMVHQAFAMVDLDSNGTLDFEEAALLMAVYRNSEGFAHEEVEEVAKKFQENSSLQLEQNHNEMVVPVNKLASVLTSIFGHFASDGLAQIEKEVAATVPKQVSGEVPLGMTFPEVLTWARRLRYKEFDKYRDVFDAYDVDTTGSIDLDEMQQVCVDLGITLTRAAMDEISMKAREQEAMGHGKEFKPHSRNATTLDYDEFVNVMQAFQDADGFTAAEQEHFKVIFDRFDLDKSGELDTIELVNVLQYMGHKTKLYVVQSLVEKVDFDGNGILSFREFTRLMRMHREEELKPVKLACTLCSGEVNPLKATITVAGARKSLLNLEFNHEELDQLETTGALDRETLSFDEFVALVDSAREVRTVELRRRAGFCDADIETYRRLFKQNERDRRGLLDLRGLNNMLEEIGFSTDFRTKEEQQDFAEVIEHARGEAVARGDKEPGSGKEVSFWVVVQLLRSLNQQNDRATLNKITSAAEDSRFNSAEVAQFREVFVTWFEKDAHTDEDHDTEAEQPEVCDDAKTITRASLRRLLRSLGVRMDNELRVQLDDKATEVHGKGDEDKVDFPDFLRIMRWMMDINFGDISGAAAAKGPI